MRRKQSNLDSLEGSIDRVRRQNLAYNLQLSDSTDGRIIDDISESEEEDEVLAEFNQIAKGSARQQKQISFELPTIVSLEDVRNQEVSDLRMRDSFYDGMAGLTPNNVNSNLV